MASQRVAAVTGANKGIGLAIVRNLALSYPTSPLNNGTPLLIYLTARDSTRGTAALSALQSDPALQSTQSTTRLAYHDLDITSSSSIGAFASFLAAQHPSGIDVLINNAGIALEGFDAAVVADTLACNYHGTLAVTAALLPRLRRGQARIVNVSSSMGSLSKYPDDLADRFRNAQSIDQVSALMARFEDAVKEGRHVEEGWPSAAYAVSKAGVTAVSKVMGRSEELREQGLLVNAVCPGFVKTDMSKGRGQSTADQGAETPVLLALGDIGGVTGEYWRKGKVREW